MEKDNTPCFQHIVDTRQAHLGKMVQYHWFASLKPKNKNNQTPLTDGWNVMYYKPKRGYTEFVTGKQETYIGIDSSKCHRRVQHLRGHVKQFQEGWQEMEDPSLGRHRPVWSPPSLAVNQLKNCNHQCYNFPYTYIKNGLRIQKTLVIKRPQIQVSRIRMHKWWLGSEQAILRSLRTKITT